MSRGGKVRIMTNDLDGAPISLRDFSKKYEKCYHSVYQRHERGLKGRDLLERRTTPVENNHYKVGDLMCATTSGAAAELLGINTARALRDSVDKGHYSAKMLGLPYYVGVSVSTKTINTMFPTRKNIEAAS